MGGGGVAAGGGGGGGGGGKVGIYEWGSGTKYSYYQSIL